MHRLLTVAIAVATLGAVSAPASAGSYYSNAVGICQGALPSFEGAFRKRPLAIANEGSSNAFLSCTLPVDQTFVQANTVVGVALVNRSAALVAVACTFVDGTVPELLGGVAPTLYPKNIALAAGEGASLRWLASEYDLPAFSRFASVSCSLPPGVELAAMATAFTETP